MYFNEQMLAVIQVIWTLRSNPGEGEKVGRRKLNHIKVADAANVLLGKWAEKREEDPPTVSRQNWYNKGVKAEWKAIKRAIKGEPPLPGQEGVEDEIKKFDEDDETGILKELNRELQRELTEKNAVIEGREEECERCKIKAYTDQHTEFRFEYEYETLKNGFENAQRSLAKEEKLRQGYQVTANSLRKTVNDLKKQLAKRDLGLSDGATPIHIDFYPDLTAIAVDEPKTMLRHYNTLREEAWERLKDKAKKKPPGHIILVFHKFNVDEKALIETKLPLVAGPVNYVFACYQPSSSRRQKMHAEAASFLPMPPSVVIVEGAQASQNVVQLDAGKRDVREQLCSLVQGQGRGFEYYDFFEEGYEFVQVVRASE